MSKLWQRWVLGAAMAAMAAPALASGNVNIYSYREETLLRPLLDAFTAQTGIRTSLVTVKEDALIERLKNEGANSPADLLMTVDAARLIAAKDAGLFQRVDSPSLVALVPMQYRDPEGHWFAVSMRARPIMYAKERVRVADLSTYEGLADAKWKGRICIRSSSSAYNQSLVASLIAHNGVDKTEAWAKGLVANFARTPKGGDRDQILAVAAGECDIAVANTYYLAGMTKSPDAAQRQAAKSVGVFWPNQGDRGAHVNVSGVGVAAHAKNRENAIKLIEFLATDQAQRIYAEKIEEYGIRPTIEPSFTLAGWGAFKADRLPLASLARHNAEAVKLADRVGWR
jgi:iron(III) transport system substrate-binding protein